MMICARTLGFEIVLVYIGTEKVEINLARIAQRVLSGGHDVPEADALWPKLQEPSGRHPSR
jgi:predicted ABC-type ATPase